MNLRNNNQLGNQRMSMNIINSLSIPASDNSVTKSENGCENKGAFHQLLDEKKDKMALNIDKKGNATAPSDPVQADAILLPSERIETLGKNCEVQNKKTDSEEIDDLSAWLMAMGLPVLPEKESVGWSMTAATDSSQITFLDIGHTAQLSTLLTADTIFDEYRVKPFSGRSINGLSFENDTMNTSVFNNTNEPELINRIPIWNRFSENETPTLMIHTHPTVPVASTSQTPTVSLNVPVNSPQWQDLLGQQIVFFNRNDIHKAHIRLHPEELGSLHIQLDMQDGKIHMTLGALHSAVKGVLESAVPHLRISLAEQGIDLQSVHVNDDMSMAFHQESSPPFHQPNFSHFCSEDAVETVHTEDKVANVSMGGVSVFA